MPGLTFSDSEHFRATCWAHALSRRPPILHGYGPSVFYFPFGTAFHTVCLHWAIPPFFVWFNMNDKPWLPVMSIVSLESHFMAYCYLADKKVRLFVLRCVLPMHMAFSKQCPSASMILSYGEGKRREHLLSSNDRELICPLTTIKYYINKLRCSRRIF